MLGSGEIKMMQVDFKDMRSYLQHVDLLLAKRADHIWNHVSRNLHAGQTGKAISDSSLNHCLRVEENIWNLITSGNNIYSFNSVEIFLLSIASCSHDYDKAIIMPENSNHGVESGKYISGFCEKLSLNRSECTAIRCIIACHAFTGTSFGAELLEIPASLPVNNKHVNLQLLAVLLKAGDVLDLGNTRIVEEKIISEDSLSRIERIKYNARKNVSGYTIDGTRIIVKALPENNEDLLAIRKGFNYLSSKEWEPIINYLKFGHYPYDLQLEVDDRYIKADPLHRVKECFLFPFDMKNMSLAIVRGSGKLQQNNVGPFGGSGSIELAEKKILNIAQVNGIDTNNIITTTSDKYKSYNVFDKNYLFAIASPAVNDLCKEILSNINRESENFPIRFCFDNYPKDPVVIKVEKSALTEQQIKYLDPNTTTNNKDNIIFYPAVSENKRDGVDYGIVIRHMTIVENTKISRFILAGCKNFGTWASYLSATEPALLEKIQEFLGFEFKGRHCSEIIWALVKGVGKDSMLDTNDITVVSAGFVKPKNKEIVDINFNECRKEKIGFLQIGRSSFRVQFSDGQLSGDETNFTYVHKANGVDSVAVLLYYIDNGVIRVGIIEQIKPIISYRSKFIDNKDYKKYLKFKGIIAGGLDEIKSFSSEEIDKQAAIEVFQEVGCKIDEKNLLNLGCYFTTPGYAMEKMHLRAYRIDSLNFGVAGGDGSDYEHNIKIKFIDIQTVLSMCNNGEIEDPKTEISVHRLCSKLKISLS